MAYGKFKMGRGDGRKTIQPVKPKDEMESSRKGDGRMYTGGTPNFNERTGEYRDSRGKKPTPKPSKGGFVNESGKRKLVVPKTASGRVKPIAPKLPGRGNGNRTIQPVKPKKTLGSRRGMGR